jgi:hypothetical protein
MDSVTSKTSLIVIIAFSMGTLSLFIFIQTDSFSLGVPGSGGITPISSNTTGGGVPGSGGITPISSNTTGGGVPGSGGLSKSDEALINIYNTIITQQQAHIQFLLDQQKTLRDLLIKSSSP